MIDSYRKSGEPHFTLPHKEKTLGLFTTGLLAILTLTSCVSPERLQASTVLQCDVPSTVFEGGNLRDENRPYFPILALGNPVFVNPFIVIQGGEEFLVGYYGEPPMQLHVRKNKTSPPEDCRVTKGSLVNNLYTTKGYLFRADDSEKEFWAGSVQVDRLKK